MSGRDGGRDSEVGWVVGRGRRARERRQDRANAGRGRERESGRGQERGEETGPSGEEERKGGTEGWGGQRRDSEEERGAGRQRGREWRGEEEARSERAKPCSRWQLPVTSTGVIDLPNNSADKSDLPLRARKPRRLRRRHPGPRASSPIATGGIGLRADERERVDATVQHPKADMCSD